MAERNLDIKSYLKDKKTLVEGFLASYCETPCQPPRLHEAMRYSLLAGGKRIRPVLCLASYEACGGAAEDILAQACAIEFIHTYSLVHDDLPAMDDDELRRGQPTSHIVFGEAMAILAGDALLTDAFRIFSLSETVPPGVLLVSLRELASAAGIGGMVAGQAQDILSEHAPPDEATVRFIHTHKTAALIRASVRIGALLSGTNEVDRFTRYGEHVGLAFQVVDDILDIVASTEELGKPRGSDMEKCKMTYPAVYGIERAKVLARDLVGEAVREISGISGDPAPLIGIAEYLGARTS